MTNLEYFLSCLATFIMGGVAGAVLYRWRGGKRGATVSVHDGDEGTKARMRGSERL